MQSNYRLIQEYLELSLARKNHILTLSLLRKLHPEKTTKTSRIAVKPPPKVPKIDSPTLHVHKLQINKHPLVEPIIIHRPVGTNKIRQRLCELSRRRLQHLDLNRQYRKILLLVHLQQRKVP